MGNQASAEDQQHPRPVGVKRQHGQFQVRLHILPGEQVSKLRQPRQPVAAGDQHIAQKKHAAHNQGRSLPAQHPAGTRPIARPVESQRHQQARQDGRSRRILDEHCRDSDPDTPHGPLPPFFIHQRGHGQEQRQGAQQRHQGIGQGEHGHDQQSAGKYPESRRHHAAQVTADEPGRRRDERHDPDIQADRDQP